jgi:DNA-binding SARP family transcriptional activator
LTLHALELLCVELTAAGHYARAAHAAVAAVSREPLRESAQRALIGVYLAEGNQGEAVRQYHAFESLLSKELGLAPSQKMLTLVAPLGI